MTLRGPVRSFRRRVESIDVALSRLRGVGITTLAIAAAVHPTGFTGRIRAPWYVIAGAIIGLLVAANLVARVRRRRDRTSVAVWVAAEVALDLAASLILMFQAGPAGPSSMIVTMPVLEAGLRFGTLGVLLAWGAVAAALGTDLAVFWPPGQLASTFRLMIPTAASILLLALPTSYLAEFLIAAVYHSELTNRLSDERAEALASLTAAAPRLVSFRRDVILESVVDLAAQVGCVDPEIRPVSATDPERDTHTDWESAPGVDERIRRTITTPEGRLELVFSDAIPVHPYRDEAVDVLILQAESALAAASAHTHLAELQQASLSESQTDALTGLGNRRGFTALAEAEGFGSRSDWALIYLDLDGFKAVNDEAGHDAGDRVLVDIANQLVERSRPGTVFRLGGDEFVIVLVGTDVAGYVHALAHIVSATVITRVRTGQTYLAVGVSAGVAVPRPGATANEVLRSADQAMYRAKQYRKQQRAHHSGADRA